MPLLGYDRSGGIVTALDFLVWPDGEGGYGLVDLAEAEASGMRLRHLWDVSGASGSCHWPEHLGERVHEFRVELDRSRSHPAVRLVHRGSGHVRERAAIEAAAEQAQALPADLREAALAAVLGHPLRPLDLDPDGRTRAQPDRDPEPAAPPRPPLRVARRP